MATYYTISDFADAIRNYENNASTYKHLNDEQLASLFLEKEPRYSQWLDTNVVKAIQNIDTSTPIAMPKDPIDGNGPSHARHDTTKTVDRSKYGITDSRHWRKYPEYEGMDVGAANPLKDLLAGAGTEFWGGTELAVEGMPNALVQSFHMLFRPDGEEKRMLGYLNRINTTLNDPNVSDRVKKYQREHQLPYWEQKYKDAVIRAQAIEDGDISGGVYNWIYETGVPYTELVNTWTQDQINETMTNSPHYQRLQQWHKDDPWGQTWSDYANPTNWASGIAQMGVSVGVSFGPRKITGALKGVQRLAGITKGKKTLDRLNRVFGNGWSFGSMYLLENSEVQRETLGYLMNDFEWIDENGNAQKGLPFEDAIGVATIAASSYALTSGWIEKWQVNRIAENLGVAKGARRSLLHNLVHKLYKELPRGRGGKIVYEGIDAMGKFWENAQTEGMQAYFSFVADEAVRKGYDLEDEVSFGKFLEESGVQIKEIGLTDLALPGFSNNPHIKQSYLAGGFGSGAGINTLNYGLGWQQDKVLKNYEEAHKNGDNVKVGTAGDGHVVLTNTNTGAMNFVATGNEHETNYVINKFINNANDGTNTVSVSGLEVNTVDDYLGILINNSMTTSGYTNQQVINENKVLWGDDKKLNKVQQLFKKHATQDNGLEIDDYKKIADLIQLTGDSKLLDDKILDLQDDLQKSKLSALASLSSEYIRGNVGKKLKNKVVTGNVSKEMADELIDNYVQDLKNLNDKKLAEAYAGGDNVLEAIFAGQINEDSQLKDRISFTQGAFKQPIDGDPRNLSPEDLIQDLNQAKFEDAFKSKFDFNPNENHVELLVAENKRNPIISLDQQNATGRSLEAHIGSLLINSIDAGVDHIQSLREVLSGQSTPNTNTIGVKSGNRINNTNLGRLLSHLKINFKAKSLQSADTRLKLIDSAIERIDARIFGSKIKIEPAQSVNFGQVKPEIIAPKSKLEKEVDQQAEQAFKEILQQEAPVKKAPAKQEIKVGNKITLYDPKGDAIEVEVTNVSDAGSFKYTYKGINKELLYDDAQYSLQNPNSPNYVLKGIDTDTPISKMSDADLSDMKKLFQKKFDDTKDDKGRNVAKWQHLANLNAVTLEQKRRAQEKKAPKKVAPAKKIFVKGMGKMTVNEASKRLDQVLTLDVDGDTGKSYVTDIKNLESALNKHYKKTLKKAPEVVDVTVEDVKQKYKIAMDSIESEHSKTYHFMTSEIEIESVEIKDGKHNINFGIINGSQFQLESLNNDVKIIEDAFSDALGRDVSVSFQIIKKAPTEADPLPDFTKPMSEQIKEGIITSEMEGDVIDVDTIDLGSDIADSIDNDIDKICP
mgnify:CR=1 FL=1